MSFFQNFFSNRRKKLLNNLLTDVNFLDWHQRREKRNRIIAVSAVISVVVILISGWLVLNWSYQWVKEQKVAIGNNGDKNNTSLISNSLDKLLDNLLGTNTLIGLAKFSNEFLGFNRPKVYLLLLENNAELRPAGGFIGYYMVVRVDRGQVKILESADSYVLDRYAVDKLKIKPPEPLTKYNNVKYWYLRDANWSPDFLESARKALWFYQEESKLSPESARIESFDGVVAFTPTFIRDIIGLAGELKVGDEIFNQANFISELQYYIEIGYQKDTADWYQRKGILKELAKQLITKVEKLPIDQKLKIFGIVQDNLSNKQILLYSEDPDSQKFLEERNYAGRISKGNDQSDYLMVVDANWASLKTDLKIDRSISYQISEDSQFHDWMATVTIKYDHRGGFDWATTRYRDYVRVYIPAGSEVVSAAYRTGEKNNDYHPYDVIPYDVSSDKTVVSSFIIIEPGASGELSFSYFLPQRLQKPWLENGKYQLIWQKQAGAANQSVKLDFRPTNVLKLWNGILSEDLTIDLNK